MLPTRYACKRGGRPRAGGGGRAAPRGVAEGCDRSSVSAAEFPDALLLQVARCIHCFCLPVV